MTDYQHLVNELTWFAEQDKDFITLHESINTKAAEAIKALVAERDKFAARRCEVCGYMEHHREHTGCLRKEVERLTAERDELLASSTRIKLELAELRDREPVAYMTYKGILLHADDPKVSEHSNPEPLFAKPAPRDEKGK